MMNKKLEILINGGENSKVEFKTSFDKETIITIGAMANTNGGTVIIGVNDKKQITGIKIGKETIQTWLNQIKQATNPAIIPDIENTFFNEKSVISLSINSFPIKPVSVKGRYYKRVKNSNHLLSSEEISDLHLKTFNSSWDYYLNTSYKLEDISFEKVAEIKGEINKNRDIPITDKPLKILTKYELLKNGNITNACFLLFLNNESALTCIEAARFSGETIIKDAVSLRTNLFDEVELLLSFIKKHVNKEYVITGKAQREERWEYPLEAVREIVIHPVR